LFSKNRVAFYLTEDEWLQILQPLGQWYDTINHTNTIIWAELKETCYLI